MIYEIRDPLPTRLGLLVVPEPKPVLCKFRAFGKVTSTPGLLDVDPYKAPKKKKDG